jgi:putative transposase
MGNLLFVTVHAANIHDTKGGAGVFAGAFDKYPTIKGICADAGYRKTFEEYVKAWGKSVEIVKRINPKEWVILPKRWIACLPAGRLSVHLHG